MAATAIEKRHSKQCDICMLIDVDNKEMKWHLYKEGYIADEEHYVCDDCVNGLGDIRKKCNQKFDNPKHAFFAGFVPWFILKIDGMAESFRRNVETPPSAIAHG